MNDKLFYSCIHRRDDLKTWLQRGVSPNSRYENEETLLHIVCRYGYLDVVEILLDPSFGNMDPNLVDSVGKTPLHNAVTIQNSNIVRKLLEKGANPNIADKNGETPLIIASRKRYINIAKDLLLNGADPNLVDKQHRSPLYFAIENKDLPFVKMLLNGCEKSKRADPNIANITKETPLYRAIVKEDLDIIETLLTASGGVNLNIITDKDISPLSLACSKGRLDIVKLLLKFGADPNLTNRKGKTALNWISDTGKFDMVETLLLNGADPTIADWNGNIPIHFAFLYQRDDIVKLLKEHFPSLQTLSSVCIRLNKVNISKIPFI